MDPMWMQMYGKRRPEPDKVITSAELAKHNTQNDLWIAFHGKVYDVTRFRPYHPGGTPSLMKAAGMDGTNWFESVHGWVDYDTLLGGYCVGHLEGHARQKSSEPPPPSYSAATKKPAPATKEPSGDMEKSLVAAWQALKVKGWMADGIPEGEAAERAFAESDPKGGEVEISLLRQQFADMGMDASEEAKIEIFQTEGVATYGDFIQVFDLL